MGLYNYKDEDEDRYNGSDESGWYDLSDCTLKRELKDKILRVFADDEVKKFRKYFPDAMLSSFEPAANYSKSSYSEFTIKFTNVENGCREAYEAYWIANLSPEECYEYSDIADGAYKILNYMNPMRNIPDILSATAENMYRPNILWDKKALYSSEFAVAIKFYCSQYSVKHNDWVSNNSVHRGDNRFFTSVEDFIENSDINVNN